METLRLRQAVVAASDRDAVVDVWSRELGIGEPFHDDVVETFGLRNAVVPLGDTFLEVVTPLQAGDGCAAERFMARNSGDCGYMAIFQVLDMDDARDHLDDLGIRRVLDADVEDIRCTHVHPADLGAAIVSFDQAMPPESWRWGGPDWAQRSRTSIASGLAGIRLACDDPAALLERWRTVLAVEQTEANLRLADGSYVDVQSTDATGGRSGLVGIDLWAVDGVEERAFEVAAVEFRLVASTGRRP